MKTVALACLGISVAARILAQSDVPRFLTQPQNVTATEGGALTFQLRIDQSVVQVPVGPSVFGIQLTTDAPAPTSYKIAFQSRTVDVSVASIPDLFGGAVNAFFNFGPVAISDAGTFRILATNAKGTAQSSAATLTVTPVTPVILTQPVAQSAVEGGSVTFSASVAGEAPFTFQWVKNGAAVAGGTNAALTISNVTLNDAGAYSVIVRNSKGLVTSQAATLTILARYTGGRLTNLSIRTTAGAGDSTLIVGFGIGGTGTNSGKALLLRGVGPTLGTFGVTGALVDPIITLFNGPTQVAQNDDWAGGFDASTVGAFGFVGTAPRDAAIYSTNLSNGSYTLQIVGKNNTAGVALAEIYDATPIASFTSVTPRLINVSARATVGGGENAVIAGFVVVGSAPVRLLIRAIGPTLTNFGVAGAVSDPSLTVVTGDSRTVATNNGWGTDQATIASLQLAFGQTGAFSLPAGSRDAAIVAAFAAGSYTAQVTGANSTGVVLIEVYELPSP